MEQPPPIESLANLPRRQAAPMASYSLLRRFPFDEDH